MRSLYLLPLLCFAATISVCLCDACSVSAPEASLIEYDGGCDGGGNSRSDACQNAMTQFCGGVTHPSDTTMVGLPQNVSTDDEIRVSCVPSMAERVEIVVLQQFRSTCNVQNSQHRSCITAIHGYCTDKYGQGYAGISQTVSPPDALIVHCFKSTHEEMVHKNLMNSLHGGCEDPVFESRQCFVAASRFCSQYFGYSGGITQGRDGDLMTVSCYNADFNGDVFIRRSQNFYIARSEIQEVCDISFDVTNARIVSQTSDFLKTEIYDNSQSTVELESSFEVAKEMIETSRFESSSLKFRATTTFNKFSFPFIVLPIIVSGGGSVSTGSISTENISEESSVTKRYVQSSTVHVPPGRKIIKEAKLSWGEIEVPYTAKVINGLGNVQTITGTWYGVSSYDLQIDQRNLY